MQTDSYLLTNDGTIHQYDPNLPKTSISYRLGYAIASGGGSFVGGWSKYVALGSPMVHNPFASTGESTYRVLTEEDFNKEWVIGYGKPQLIA